MKAIQLSLFDDSPLVVSEKEKLKTPRLGRYQNLKRQLEMEESDSCKIFVDVRGTKPGVTKYNFWDLFSGAGGMTVGLVQAGYQPLASVEIDKIASKTYQKNFPSCQHFNGDIVDFKPEVYLDKFNSEVHIVAGGPPCQGFSVAGARDENDPRNFLFKEFVRVVDKVKPWYIIMENVPGILTMSKGAIKDQIFQSFHNIGYDKVSVAILESAEFGIPQIRPRTFFIANRLGMENPFPSPQLKPDEYISIEKAIGDLPSYKRIPEINHEWTRHSDVYMERLAKVPPGGSLYKSYADAFKRQYPGKPSMTVKENHGGTHIHPYLNRVISAREMARLQSFPDSFVFEGKMKKAMWQIGNAVPPRLAECLGLALLPYLQQANVIQST